MYKVTEVPISKIAVSDQALRYELEDDSIIELANDVAAHGLLQPIGVGVVDGKGFQLLWGGRRLAAHRRLGRTKILAHVYERGSMPVKAVALVENLQRVNLTLQEECDAVAYLHYEEKKSPDQISALISKSRSWVMRRLALPNLPPCLRGPVFDNRLSISSAEEISRIEDDGAVAYVAQQAIQMGWSASDVRTAVETYLATPSLQEAAEAGQRSREASSSVPSVLKECAACGRPEEIVNLVNVWLHRNGCEQERGAAEGGKEDEH